MNKYCYRFACLVASGVLLGCDSPPSPMLSYDELKRFPAQCTKADQQLRQLHAILEAKNFDSDPDKLNDDDRAYNRRLKSTIWWFAYECDQS